MKTIARVAISSQSACVLFLPENKVMIVGDPQKKEFLLFATFPMVVTKPMLFSLFQIKNLNKHLLVYNNPTVTLFQNKLIWGDGHEVFTDITSEIIPLDYPLIEKIMMHTNIQFSSTLRLEETLCTKLIKETDMKHDWILTTEKDLLRMNCGHRYECTTDYTALSHETYIIPHYVLAFMKVMKPEKIHFSNFETFSLFWVEKFNEIILKVHVRKKMLQET
jgi:hypothetical protein